MISRLLIIFLACLIFTQNVGADCFPIRRIMEPAARANFQNLCRAAVQCDPACKDIEPHKLINCSGTQDSNKLLASGNIGRRILSCARAFFIDSMVDLANMVIDLIKMLVGAQINSFRNIYKFMTDSDFRQQSLSRSSQMSGAARAFLESSTRNFSTEYSKNFKKAVDRVGYINAPLAALGETLMRPFLSMVVNLLNDIAHSQISQFRCLNSQAKLDAICSMAGSLIMPPAVFFGLLRAGVAGLRTVRGAEGLLARTRTSLKARVRPQPRPSPSLRAQATPPPPRTAARPSPSARRRNDTFVPPVAGVAARVDVPEVRINGLSPIDPAAFTSRWATRQATTTSQNERWIRLAQQGRQPGMIFVDTQNVMLKFLNDNISDKSLVDALGNRYNSMVKEALEEFKRLRPGTELDLYSDYKSLRAAIRGPPDKVAELTQELQLKLSTIDRAFNDEIKNLRLLPPELAGRSFFRSGVGSTHDEANLVTRFARRDEDGVTGSFQSSQVQSRVKLAQAELERNRELLQTNLGNSILMTPIQGGNKAIPSEMVLEVVRKNSDPQMIQKILQDRTGVRLTLDDAKTLKTYANQVDQFSPALIISNRVSHNFDTATHGGFTVDFAGVGSWNLSGTAQGMAINNNLDSAITAVRIHEQRVTRRMDEVKRIAEENVKEVLSRHNISAQITISGDDMVVIPSTPLSASIRAEIAQAQSRVAETPSSIRMSFFPAGMSDATARVTKATVGENIEKRLRKRLESRLGYEQLRESNFAIDMSGVEAASGQARLIMQASSNITPAQRQTIMDEFNQAVREVAQENKTIIQPTFTPSLNN